MERSLRGVGVDILCGCVLDGMGERAKLTETGPRLMHAAASSLTSRTKY